MSKFKELIPLILVGLFFLFFAFQINFYQNDDWVYSINVESFLTGSFKLHWYVGPTFLAQGLVGALFAYFFGLSRLPLLTGLVAVTNVFLVYFYLKRKFKHGWWVNFLTTGVTVFNPLFVYTSLGFLTEQYFIFVLLASLFLIDDYLTQKRIISLLLLVALTFVGLLVRQVTLVIPLSLAFYFFYKRWWKDFIISGVWFGTFYFYLEFLFPKTKRMIEVPLQFHHYGERYYVAAVVWGSLLMLTAFLLPLVVVYLRNFLSELFATKKYRTLILFVVASFAILLMAKSNFKPDTISWGEFPYFENTLERTGFYPRGIHGTKYQFAGNFKLYKYWDLVAWVLTVPLVAAVIIRITKNPNYYLFFAVVYIVMTIATETFYDRYLLPLIPIFAFYLLDRIKQITKVEKLMLGLFSGFLLFFSYNLAMDFTLVNKYAWSKSIEIVKNEQIIPERVHSTNAWKLLNPNEGRYYKYIFSYDDTNVNQDFAEKYTLYDKKTIKYPLNFFINPTVYVYEIL